MARKRRDIPGKTPAPARRSPLAVAAVAVLAVAAGLAWWAWPGTDPANAAPGEVVVYKSPTCGCCGKWVDHMRAAGFKVTVNETMDMDTVKDRYHVPYEMGSCHTAVVDGYVVEGHVPAGDVARLLAAKPKVAGISVPDMPIGSPGMEQDGGKEPFKVYTFGPDGARVFAEH
ncbi:MAG: DUF411 domain-containing protein [Hyphomicrobiales bacterium]|nr:DUF411 domain-containing protein [Hyphomicrobiales bacterium]MCP5373994.1 DUF411 domain-containing protein [Hyphomicrobiales bacterium]